MRSQYDRINDLLIKYKYLFDLDLFISKQKNEFPPFIINEELILFQVNNFEIENTEHRLHISDDIYIIELIKVSDSELFYFSFKWINPPTEWRYDLKILLYYKDKNNQYVNLMNSPTEVTIQDNFKVICSINLKEKVLSIKKSEFNLSETFNESNGNRNNSIGNIEILHIICFC